MIRRVRKSMKEQMLGNWNYKALALVVAIFLWVVVIGQREAKITQTFSLNFLSSANQTVTNKSVDRIEVELSGAPMRLKTVHSQQDKTLTVDLRQKKAGRQVIELTKDRFDLPVGVKVISIKPSTVKAEIVLEARDGVEP